MEDPLVKNTDMDSEEEGDNCSVSYFRSKLATETTRLTDLCDSWEKKLEINKEVIPDVTEVVHVCLFCFVLGKHLLASQWSS